MKIIKPQKLALLTRTFEDDGQAYMVLTAMAFFPFAEPRKLLHEVTLWAAAAKVLGRDAVLDAAMGKQRGEVLVAGSAFAKDGAPTPATSVRVQIGAVDKQLYVIGDRRWTPKGASDPVPFVEMPVTWERAFGGEGYAKNPLGRGVRAVAEDGKSVHPLPNVEDPKALVSSPRDRPEPAALGPIDQTWPQRMTKVGTYDDEWLRTRFPNHAKDFDWEFWNTAPEDQRIAGWFALDERFRIEGMHPERRVLEARLPGVTARLFVVRRPEGAEEEMVEAASRLDTVYLFPSIERGVVIFRGMLPVTEDDGADVKHVIAAFEDPAAPRDAAHYRGVLEKRLDKRRGALHALLDDDLLPAWDVSGAEVPEDDWNDMAKVVETEDLRRAYVQRKVDREVEATRARYVELGLDPAELDAKMKPPIEAPPKDLRGLGDYLDRVEALLEKGRAEAKEKEAAAVAEARAKCAELGLDLDRVLAEQQKSGGGPPRFTADREIEKLRDLIQLGKNADADVSELEAKVGDAAFLAQLRDAEARQIEAYRRFTHHFPEAPEPAEGERARLREVVIAAHARGESLAGRDLTGVDLSGLALPGVDLREALLEKADLSGAALPGAKLAGATLARAKLGKADLSGADLHQTNLGKADAREAVFGGADLQKAVCYEADLRGATLRGAKLDGAQLHGAQLAGVDLGEAVAEGLAFLEADLTGAKFRGARLTRATFLRAKLAGADFSRAALPQTSFVECSGDDASFAEAALEGTRFALGSTFTRADFRGATMKQTLLRSCGFVEADFSGARADDSDFSESDLTRAKLVGASAQRSLFIRTVLREADARGVNLMHAVLQKAKVHGADLRGANLFRADVAKVRGDDQTSFAGAYVVQARVVPEKNQPKVLP